MHDVEILKENVAPRQATRELAAALQEDVGGRRQAAHVHGKHVADKRVDDREVELAERHDAATDVNQWKRVAAGTTTTTTTTTAAAAHKSTDACVEQRCTHNDAVTALALKCWS